MAEVYFWIAEYQDGRCLPEFELDTGDKHQWGEVDLDRVKTIHWKPYTTQLINRITSPPHDERVANPLLPSFSCGIPSKGKPIRRREANTIFDSFKKCLQCGEEFSFSFEEGSYFQPKHSDKIRVICPNCGASDGGECDNCGYFLKDTWGIKKCPKCGLQTPWQYKKNIVNDSRTETYTNYIFGYELGDRKVIMRIDEKGNCNLNNE